MPLKLLTIMPQTGGVIVSHLLSLPRLRRLGKDDEGQALVLAALGMIVLLLMAGLGVDVGYLRYQKQQMQKAADAGALAGASALIYYRDGIGEAQITAAAKSDSQANGFTDGDNGVMVTVNHPPQTAGDPFLADSRYVEVIVTQQRPTFFMRLLGFDQVNVSSRAVATSVGSGSGCFYSLATTGADVFDVGPGATVSSSCGILVGSADPAAFHAGTGANVTARSIGIVGDCTGCGGLSTQPTTGIAPFTDPLANVPSPSIPPGCSGGRNYSNGGLNANLSAGNYCGGISLTGGTVTLGPGTYYLIGGGMNVTGGTSLTGTGVTFYNTSGQCYPYGPITVTNSSGNTNLSAPTDGNLAGILMFQDRLVGSGSNPNVINASSGQIYTGALYFPTTALQYHGSQIVNPYELLIAWRLQLSGFVNVTSNYQSLPAGGSPVQNATLVE